MVSRFRSRRNHGARTHPRACTLVPVLCRRHTCFEVDDNLPGRSALLPQQVLRPAKLKGLVPQCENRRILALLIFRQDRIHSWPYDIDALAHGHVTAHPLHRAPFVQVPCTGNPLRCRRAARKQIGSAANKIEPIS